MDNASDLMNDYEKLSLTFEYVLILENKYAELKKRLKKYKKELDSFKSDNLKKDAVIASKVDEINLLEGELDDYKSRCDDLISDLSDYEKFKEDLDFFKSDNLEKDLVIASKVDEINLLEGELDDYKSRCDDLISDLSDYDLVKKDLISFKSDNFKKDVVIASKEDRINFLEAELDEYKMQCRDLNIIIGQKNKHIDELENNVRSLKNEIHDLKFDSEN